MGQAKLRGQFVARVAQAKNKVDSLHPENLVCNTGVKMNFLATFTKDFSDADGDLVSKEFEADTWLSAIELALSFARSQHLELDSIERESD